MKRADLLDSDCSWMPPTCWWVRTPDGHLLVSKLELERTIPGVPVNRVNLPTGVLVFLADDRGRPIDADNDPSNGMTPLFTLDECDHEDGLRALGYELTWED